MEQKSPVVTVLMAAYNAAPFLRKSLDSVLCQSFKDFEIVIIDDGSTDETGAILDEYCKADKRIVKLVNEHNMGLIASLNRGIEAARGKYIARFDADDIMLGKRLEIQVRYLEKHPDVGLLCAQSVVMSHQTKCRNGIFRNSCLWPELETGLLAKCTISHTCVTFRRELLIKTGLRYSDEYVYMEDYGLWANLLLTTKYKAQPYEFAVYRHWDGSVTHTVYTEKAKTLLESRRRVISVVFKKFGISLPQEQFDIYCRAMAFHPIEENELKPLNDAIFSVMKQVPKKHKRGIRLLYIYYQSIWKSAANGRNPKGCGFITFTSKIWGFCKTIEKIYYRRMKIKVKEALE